MTRHHPAEATLLACAAGTLPRLHARVLEFHLSACPRCHRQVRNFNEVGGALLTSLSPAPLRPDAMTRTLARLDKVPSATNAAAPSLVWLATGRWWWAGSGVRLMPLVRRDETDTRLDLVRVAAGVALPEHTHTGPETVCILQGSFNDETGHYALHDIAESDGTLLHQPVAAPGPDCICLIATTGRLRANGWLARLIQPLIDV